MDWDARIASYEAVTRFPRSLFVAGDGRVVGTWIMGNDYRVKSGYYGGYPAGYLRRVAALFPDRKRVLHVFSGKVDLAAMPGDTVDLNSEMAPTWVADAHDLAMVPLHHYDLVMADPPYSVEDAERYQTTMVRRNVVMRSLARGMSPGARWSGLAGSGTADVSPRRVAGRSRDRHGEVHQPPLPGHHDLSSA